MRSSFFNILFFISIHLIGGIDCCILVTVANGCHDTIFVNIDADKAYITEQSESYSERKNASSGSTDSGGGSGGGLGFKLGGDGIRGRQNSNSNQKSESTSVSRNMYYVAATNGYTKLKTGFYLNFAVPDRTEIAYLSVLHQAYEGSPKAGPIKLIASCFPFESKDNIVIGKDTQIHFTYRNPYTTSNIWTDLKGVVHYHEKW